MIVSMYGKASVILIVKKKNYPTNWTVSKINVGFVSELTEQWLVKSSQGSKAPVTNSGAVTAF